MCVEIVTDKPKRYSQFIQRFVFCLTHQVVVCKFCDVIYGIHRECLKKTIEGGHFCEREEPTKFKMLSNESSNGGIGYTECVRV